MVKISAAEVTEKSLFDRGVLLSSSTDFLKTAVLSIKHKNTEKTGQRHGL